MQCKLYKGVDRFADYRVVYEDWYRCSVMEPTNEGIVGGRVIAAEHNKTDDAFFFVEQAFVDAALGSDITFTVDWQSMPFPFDAFTFVLPKSAGDIGMVSVCKTFTKVDGQDGVPALIIRAYFMDEVKTLFDAVLTSPYNPEVFHRRNDIGNRRQEAVRIAFNLMFAMAARPEYVEMGRRTGTHKKTSWAIRYPNVIGRKYVAKTSGEGTHASPNTHWRRGHFRRQPCGVGRKDMELIWIERTLIIGKEKAA